MSECCTLYRLGLCPECAEREEEEAALAAADMAVETQIKWEQERRLFGAEV